MDTAALASWLAALAAAWRAWLAREGGNVDHDAEHTDELDALADELVQRAGP